MWFDLKNEAMQVSECDRWTANRCVREEGKGAEGGLPECIYLCFWEVTCWVYCPFSLSLISLVLHFLLLLLLRLIFILFFFLFLLLSSLIVILIFFFSPSIFSFSSIFPSSIILPHLWRGKGGGNGRGKGKKREKEGGYYVPVIAFTCVSEVWWCEVSFPLITSFLLVFFKLFLYTPYMNFFTSVFNTRLYPLLIFYISLFLFYIRFYLFLIFSCIFLLLFHFSSSSSILRLVFLSNFSFWSLPFSSPLRLQVMCVSGIPRQHSFPLKQHLSTPFPPSLPFFLRWYLSTVRPLPLSLL